MIFTPDQIAELVQIVDFNHVLFGADIAGTSVLSGAEIDLLAKYGIDVAAYPFAGIPQVEQAFHFGRLASALGNVQTKNISYNDFRKFVQAGGHRPLSIREKYTLEGLKSQSFRAVKGLGNKITQDLSQVVGETEAIRRGEYESILRQELSEGVVSRKTVSDIVRDLGKRTGDWERDLGRLVETELHNAYEEGRAAELEEKHGGDVIVYKDVYAGACRHCIKHYLTAGIGSKPRTFKLSALRANGTNIGKKVAQWKAVLGAMHPFCRCTLNIVPKGYEWDETTRSFTKLDGYVPKHDFTITVTIGGKKYTY